MHHAADIPDGTTVLIVEDHADLRRIMKEVLEFEGYQAIAVDHGGAALELLQQIKTLPGLILADVVMDEMDGCELFRILRNDARWKDIPFVFVSGKMQVEVACMDLPAPADGYIEKPFTLGDFLNTVRATVQSQP